MITIIIYTTYNQVGGLRQLATAKGAGYAKPGRQEGPDCANSRWQRERATLNRGSRGAGLRQTGPFGPAQTAAVVVAKSLPQSDDAMW